MKTDKRLDGVIIHVYREMNRVKQVSTEDILCDPHKRQLFLSSLVSLSEEVPVSEEKALRRLSSLRKTSLLPRFFREKKS